MATEIRDARPPTALVRAGNPLVRTVLRSPLGQWIDALAVLEFTGRRTGRRYRVVTGWHVLDGDGVVFTPAVWRANFASGADAKVRHRGTDRTMRGVLETESTTVADALNHVIGDGSSGRALGLSVPPGQRISADDVVRLGRAFIRLDSART